jgi:hypothetical protein
VLGKETMVERVGTIVDEICGGEAMGTEDGDAREVGVGR